MGDLLQFAIYNPAILKDTDFLAGFVARRESAEDILQRLRDITPKSLPKHRLLLGQRGMGKTSLLRRIALGVRDDESLSARLLPLTFREEQYNVHNLHTFWCNCLDALGDHFDRTEQPGKAAELDRQVMDLNRARRGPASEDEGEEALAVLKDWAKGEGKRILLLIDNIDLIFDGLAKQHWSLRRTLQEPGGITIIGAATAYLEATSDPKGAFYDFFQVTALERLSQEELIACLRRLAEARGEPGRRVLHILSTDPARIRTLHDLTGGNLRTLVLLYLLLERDADDSIMDDLDRLLDEVTVLYKARVEDLAPQARVVLDAVALNWNPLTAAQVADITGMETSAASAQLDRLIRHGLLEKVSLSTSSRAAFQLGERFFNIWYLMRHGPRRQRARLRWLTAFLRGFYSPQQLADKALTLLRRPAAEQPSSGYYCLALCGAVDSPTLQSLLGEEARRHLEHLAAQQGKRLEDIIDPSELPLLRTAGEWFAKGWWCHHKLGRPEDAETAYRKAIELEPRDSSSWINLGNLLADHLGRYEEAEVAYRRAITADPTHPYPWNNLGNLLTNHLRRYEDAEAAYHQAINLDPSIATPWNGLGNLLADHLRRYEEAHVAYRKAITLDPTSSTSWNGLGKLLANYLGCYEEAETAYYKAITLDPTSALPWNNLGNLLADHLKRYEEAEAAFQKAIELDSTFAFPYYNLGNLLTSYLGHYRDAEAAYRQAIELAPSYANPWKSLGNLLMSHLGRYEEAEAAYRKAIELDPTDATPWNGLGNLLADFLGRPEEAMEAYRVNLERDPGNMFATANLAYLHLSLGADEQEAWLQSALSKLPPHGGGLLRAYAALARDHFGEAAVALGEALASGHPELFSTYFDDLLRVLRLAVDTGYGEKLLAWMDESGMGDRHWPLRAAFDAYLHGEARLGDVNPEVGQAARRIHQWLKGLPPRPTPRSHSKLKP